MKAIKQTKIKNKIANMLKEEILSGNLKANEKLNESKLSHQLEISRTPLREAIGILEAEGFVETIPNKGSSIVNLNIEDIKEVYEIRYILEAVAMRGSVMKFTNSDLQKLKSIQLALENEVNSSNWPLVDKTNAEFHQFLYSKCDNDRLLKIVDNLDLLSRFMRVSAFMVPGRANEVLEEHEIVIQHLEAEKYEQAIEATINHIANGEKTLIEYLLNKSKEEEL